MKISEEQKELIEMAKKGENGTHLAFVAMFPNSNYLSVVRRFTEKEKVKYRDWFKDIGVKPLCDYIKLFRAESPNRNSDGELEGVSSLVWFLSNEEWDNYMTVQLKHEKELEEKRKKEQAEEEARKKQKEQEELKREKEKQELLKKVSSWDIDSEDIQDEGGWTKCYTHTFVIDGQMLQFSERNVFDFGRVINPSYSVIERAEKGGITSKRNDGTLMWKIYIEKEGWCEVRPLNKQELICMEIIRKYGKYVNTGIRM